MAINQDQLARLRRELATVETDLSRLDQPGEPEKIKSLTRRHAELKSLAALADRWETADQQLQELRTVAQDSDPELRQLADQELPAAQQRLTELESDLAAALVPADPRDQRDIIIEIRPGAGGDEAALFTAELFRMYARFAERQGWKTQLLSSTPTSVGGLKEVIFEITGRNVYRLMKYERGVHRVQRVPDTEKSGRVHTSTVTVAVVPIADEQELVIDPKDLKIVASTSSGHGGQSVNTTYSAIRLTHLPTGITVSMQDERSQTQNRLKAMEILRSRLLAKQEEERRQRESAMRKSQIGSGDRAEKIRTYNFPQDRITDHRIKLNVHHISQVLDGDLDKLLGPLRQAEQARQNHGSLDRR